jgi:hypothetical protein
MKSTYQEQQDDTDEVLPVWGSTSTVGKSNSDKGSSLHNPREGVPHEGLKEARWKKGHWSVRARASDEMAGGDAYEELKEGAEEARKGRKQRR